jgi:hypothetical protein
VSYVTHKFHGRFVLYLLAQGNVGAELVPQVTIFVASASSCFPFCCGTAGFIAEAATGQARPLSFAKMGFNQIDRTVRERLLLKANRLLAPANRRARRLQDGAHRPGRPG